MTPPDLDGKLDALVGAAHRLTRADSAIMLLEDETGELVKLASRGSDAWAPDQLAPVTDGPVARALMEARPVLVDGSYIAAPLVWHGDTLGVLIVSSATRDSLGDSHCELLAELATQAATTLVQARTFAAEEARRDQMEALNRGIERMQERLFQLEKLAAIGNLARGIAKNLNATLDVIVTNLSAPAGPSLATETLAAAQRMRTIVDSLAVFGGEAESEQLAAVYVEEAIEAAITLTWSELEGRVHVNRRYATVPPVLGNLAELTQTFVQLLVQAARGLEGRGGTIDIGIALDDEHVAVRLADNGGARPDEKVPHNIARSIVSRLGGTMDVQSAHGVGTTVTLRLGPGG
jgi:C4-dicarboxylate-specific signal transduction histidine kinase